MDKAYQKLDEDVIGIYLDYSLDSFPIDIMDLCRRMGVRLIPYSNFGGRLLELLIKKSEDGFYCPASGKPTIFYSDMGNYPARIRFTLAHELKHYVYSDTKETARGETLANHFARFLLCPTPVLIARGLDNPYDVMDIFNISFDASCNALKAMKSRKLHYKEAIFKYEKPLLRQLKLIID